MKKTEPEYYPPVENLLDEVIIEAPKDRYTVDEVCKLMSVNPEWCKDLPLNAVGYKGSYVKLKDAGVAQQNKAAAVQQNQPKETQPDPEEEPDSDNRLSESKPRKNGRRNR